MSENISSSVLFHFTNTVGKLKRILKNGFFPRYCLEYTCDPRDQAGAKRGHRPMRAEAMVCFCDLPLSLMDRHLRQYERCGIGLKKEWGIRKGVCPVLYTHENAETWRLLPRPAAKTFDGHDKAQRNKLGVLAAYTKPFEGFAWREGRKGKRRKVKHDVPFYDEREWRYVPVDSRVAPVFLSRAEYLNSRTREGFHKRLEECHALRFEPKDIWYLIVPYDDDEKNGLGFYNYVMDLYEPIYGEKDAKSATTAIMTDDVLRRDA